MDNIQILEGDCIETLKTLPEQSVQTCVTSPPYYGLRDYGNKKQIGLEETPEAYVEKLVTVFREVWRVLKDDGTLWLNLGDSYAHSLRQSGPQHAGILANNSKGQIKQGFKPLQKGYKEKDLIGIPWLVAFALRADGWYLRQDIIWAKPNPMPESVKDRCTKSHEYIFLLSKSAKYYYDYEAIKEPIKDSSISRLGQDVENQKGSDRVPGKTNGKMKAVKFGGNKAEADGTTYITANKKSVWFVTTKPYREAHFATFPPDLIEPCILAGSKEGDIVLDPFNGSGTTGEVSIKHRRNYIGCELNPDYIKLTHKRLAKVQPVLMAK